MSTNYYLRNKESYAESAMQNEQNKIIVEDIMKQIKKFTENEDELRDMEFNLERLSYVGYENIHIGKRSGGWEPIFEKQDGMFASVAELKKFYKSNSDVYEIVSEYGEILNWEELEDNLINWKGEKSHSSINVYRDKDGYQWARYEFS